MVIRLAACSKNGYVPALFEKTYELGMPWFGLFFAFALRLVPDFLVVLACNLIIYYWARSVALSAGQTDAYIAAGAMEVIPRAIP